MNAITSPCAPAQSHFALALSGYLARRDALDALPSDTDQDTEDRYSDLLAIAERRLLATPTENLGDLRALFEVVWTSPDSLPDAFELRRLFEELRRLDHNQACQTFNAANWLAWFERNRGGWIERNGEIILVAPANGAADMVEDALWYLETRDGAEQVKALIRSRVDRQDPKPSWNMLLASYRRAKAKLDEHCANPSPGADSPDLDRYEQRTGELADVHSAAMEALMAFPAPDAAALAVKTRLFAKEQLSDWHRNHEFAGIIADEAEALLGGSMAVDLVQQISSGEG